MATKKRKAPNKTKKAFTAPEQPPLPTPGTKETIDQAAKLFASLADTTVAAVLADRAGFRQAYRTIESRLHSDVDRDAWEQFQNAAVLLERHHVGQERRRRLMAGAQIR